MGFQFDNLSKTLLEHPSVMLLEAYHIDWQNSITNIT